MDFEENKQQQAASENESARNSGAPGQDDAMSEQSFAELLDASFDYTPPRRGEIRQATILQIEPNEIIVELGAKKDGIVTAQDLERLDETFRRSLKVGQTVPVYVLNPRDSDGNLVVSINMGLQQYDWDKARELLEKDEVVEVTVTDHNRGGVLVRWNMLEGFIPSSHLVSVSAGLQGNERRDALNSLVGDKLGVKVIEVDQDRRRLIFSQREAQREWRAQQKARLLSELHEGDMVRGTVTGLRDFGAFVNLGGADGLIHVSELAWHRVDHPRDVLKVGQEIDVYVLSLDRNTNRIALSRKRLLPDPWDDALERYHEGMQVEGTVTNVVDFGAFIALDDGLEGLLHLSEMGDGSLKEPYSYVKKGDRLQLRISRLEPDQRRVGFTQRWGTEQPVLSRPEGEEEAEAAEEEAPVAVAAEAAPEVEEEAPAAVAAEAAPEVEEEAPAAVVAEAAPEAEDSAVAEPPEASSEPEEESEEERES
jgi:small subunit ribosomal protein S1